jgi:hypothetical protein
MPHRNAGELRADHDYSTVKVSAQEMGQRAMATRQRVILLSAAAVLSTCPFAGADDFDAARNQASLRGSYGMTLSQSCVSAPFLPPPQIGIEPVTKTLLVDAEIISAVGTGIVHFSRDHSVTIDSAKLTEILNNQIAAGDVPVIAGSRFSCGGTYALTGSNAISLEVACSVERDPPVTVNIQPLQYEGFVSHDRRSMTLSLIDGSVQKVTVSVAGQPVQVRDRVCLQSVSLARLRAGARLEVEAGDNAD